MLTLENARKIADTALALARGKNFKPLSVVVLDARGARKVVLTEDETSLKRAEVAYGKAYGALAMGSGSRSLMTMAADRPNFVAAAMHVATRTVIALRATSATTARATRVVASCPASKCCRTDQYPRRRAGPRPRPGARREHRDRLHRRPRDPRLARQSHGRGGRRPR